MKDQPEPAAEEQPQPKCGNCCHATRSPNRIGHIICRALPPTPAVIHQGAGGHGREMVQPMYPELPADILGCGVLWNVHGSLIHAVLAPEIMRRQAEGLSGPSGIEGQGQETPASSTRSTARS